MQQKTGKSFLPPHTAPFSFTLRAHSKKHAHKALVARADLTSRRTKHTTFTERPLRPRGLAALRPCGLDLRLTCYYDLLATTTTSTYDLRLTTYYLLLLLLMRP
jgi:hypothetical protein